MKATGIIRRVDDLGRIVIPKEIRRQYGITDGAPMEYFLTPDSIILKPYKEETEKKVMAQEINEKLNSISTLLGEIKAIIDK